MVGFHRSAGFFFQYATRLLLSQLFFRLADSEIICKEQIEVFIAILLEKRVHLSLAEYLTKTTPQIEFY